MNKNDQQFSLPKKSVLVTKRLFDITASALGLIIASPVLLASAIAIVCDSKGEIIFRQTRIGKNEKPFTIYKFRTMRKSNTGLKITTKDDDRITKVGRFLRKSKIDELPQLFNVLKGDMSFVGPRPEVKEYTDLYNDRQRQIFMIRPGITDPASIRFRNENDLLLSSKDPNKTYIEEIMPCKIELGLSYIEHMSIIGDLKILIQTFITVIRD